LSASSIGTVQIGATALLADIVTAGQTTVLFNVPADAVSTLGSTEDPITLRLALEQAAGAVVEASALRATNYRTNPQGQAAVGRWDQQWSTTAATTQSSAATVGATSQRVCPPGGYTTLESPWFVPQDFAWISHRIAVDVHIPNGLPNPYWHGAVQLYYFDRPEYIQSQYIGQVELTGLPTGEWVTLSSTLPEPIYSALRDDDRGSSFQLAISADVSPSDCFAFDNVHFLGPLDWNAAPMPEEDLGPFAPVSTVGRVFGFEVDKAWQVVQGSAATLVDAPVSEGVKALSVGMSNWTLIESTVFPTSEIVESGTNVSLDLFAPAPVNPGWPGDASLYLECPSANLWNDWLAIDMIAVAPDSVQTLTFPLPGPAITALSTDNECRFRLAFSTPANAGNFVLDNLRLTD
jgi:hypothetical protein